MSDPGAARNLRGDPAFLIRLREGDSAAFNTLVATYGAPLIIHASRITGSSDAAREVVQDVFLHLWNNRAQIVDTWDILAYLYGLTRKRAINTAQSEHAASQRDYRWVKHMDDTTVVAVDAELAEEDANIRSRVWKALDDLSPRCREVFLLVWDHRMPYREIAQQLGLAEPTVRRHMSRAVQHLTDVLGTQGRTAPEE